MRNEYYEYEDIVTGEEIYNEIVAAGHYLYQGKKWLSQNILLEMTEKIPGLKEKCESQIRCPWKDSSKKRMG